MFLGLDDEIIFVVIVRASNVQLFFSNIFFLWSSSFNVLCMEDKHVHIMFAFFLKKYYLLRLTKHCHFTLQHYIWKKYLKII